MARVTGTDWEQYNQHKISDTDRYEVYNYQHAMEILLGSFSQEWAEVKEALEKLEIYVSEILAPGGNESSIPKKFDKVLYPYGWREIRISGDLIVKLYPRQKVQRRGEFSEEPAEQRKIIGYIDGHNIDFLKHQVAFDLEWNSKDQTYDRDLLAMRTYYECRLADVGIIVTRSSSLQNYFKELGAGGKYGASTTHMGKLLYRLESRRNGACPVLAIGIKKGVIIDDRKPE